MTSPIRVALLRGINVGGANKVEMQGLRDALTAADFDEVTTYINTGNVLMRSEADPATVAERVRGVIDAEFGFSVPVLVRTGDEIVSIAAEIPDDWVDGPDMKCDVMYLWEDADRPDVADDFARDGIDDVVYTAGALIWRADRDKVTKSGMMRITRTDVYKQMTIRNVNTARKLAELVAGYEA